MVVVVMALVAASCSRTELTRFDDDIEYIEGRQLGVHAPVAEGPWPVVVLLHGAGRDRHAYEVFADHLAERGAVVFNADWSVLPPSTAVALEEISCAVRYARKHAADFGGDPERVVLVGHSTAAAYAGRVATGRDDLMGACRIDASASPDGLALLSSAGIPGGQPWPYSSLGGNPELCVAVVHGRDDEVASPSRSIRTATILEEAGYDVSLEMVPGAHNDLVMVETSDPDRSEDGTGSDRQAADAVIAVIIDLVSDTSERC